MIRLTCRIAWLLSPNSVCAPCKADAQKLARMAHGHAAVRAWVKAFDAYLNNDEASLWEKSNEAYKAALVLGIPDETLLDTAGLS